MRPLTTKTPRMTEEPGRQDARGGDRKPKEET